MYSEASTDSQEEWGLHRKRKESKYTTHHNIAYRHLDFFLDRALDHAHDSLYTIDEIRQKLDEKTGVFFHGATIEKYIKKYKEKHGESPLCQVGDKYRLNHCYYTYAKIKPPKPRKYKIQL